MLAICCRSAEGPTRADRQTFSVFPTTYIVTGRSAGYENQALIINKQLEAKLLGKRLKLEKVSKTSHISQIHALIHVNSHKSLLEH